MAELVCGACKRRFVFKPEYAGKTLKCKCGQPIKAPAAVAAPVAVAADAAEDDGGEADGVESSERYDATEDEYDMAPAPLPSPTLKPPIARTAPVAAPAAPRSAMLAYAGTVRRPVNQAEESAKVTNIFVPLGLLLAGLAAYFIDARLIGINNPAADVAFVLVKAVINLTLVFTAVMIGVKLIDLGLGPVGPALLKVAAVALLPAALGEVLIPVNLLLAWVAPIVLYFGLMKFLFDMDLMEILVVTGILWVVQTWVSMLLVGLLLTSMGIGGSAAGRTFAVAMSAKPSSANGVSDDVGKTTAEIDSFAQSAIEDKKAFEAHEWLGVGNRSHVGLNLSQGALREEVDEFVKARAKKIYVTGIEKEDDEEFCTKLIVEMPSDPTDRADVLAERDHFERRDTPSKDSGEKFITVAIGLKKGVR